MATDVQQIRAKGVEVPLLDGATVTVRFGFAQLMGVEEEWGSIAALTTLIKPQLYTVPSATIVAKIIGLMLGVPAHEAATRLDPTRLDDYWTALDLALGEALVWAEPGEAGKAPATDSIGPAFTTSPPSDTAAATPNSGP